MKKLILTLLFAFLVLGCATTQIQKAETGECDRLVYNSETGETEQFVCLGETITQNGTEFKLLAEAVHPETGALIGFFDLTGDCEIDGVGLYTVSDGAYYLRRELPMERALQMIRKTEERMGLELLKQVPCLKK